ncbi:MAG: cation diffusion facilitator family transporter [Desulfitobacteriaceae bacterium]
MPTTREWLKKGNVSSASATLGNIILVIVKGFAAYASGSGAMFAEAMHTLADTVNQGFVFIGSILAERNPTRRFPTGFGRLINIFCMFAVIVVTVMAYETFREGIHLISHPAAMTNFWLSIIVLAVSISVDGYVLQKAMREITRETEAPAKGLTLIRAAMANVGRAAPPTRLVFYEDLVATAGAALAIIAIVLTEATPFKAFDGIAAVIIGFMMLGAAFKVGYDNMVGLIGVAAPREVEDKVSQIILSDPDVTDINKMRITQEGRFYHAESYIELRQGLTLAEAAQIKYRIRDNLLADGNISDVTLGIMEDNGIRDWTPEERSL